MLNKIFRKKLKEASALDREKYFFHDLINHSHSLSLWIEHKIFAMKTIDASELNVLHQEIKNMEALIVDHYQFSHKDLIPKKIVSIAMLQIELQSLLKNFLGEKADDVTLVFLSADIAHQHHVNFPLWMRLLTNMVKNLNEHHACQIYFEFSISDNGLNLYSYNHLEKIDINDFDFEKKLEVCISEINEGKTSLGVESIQYLVEGAGGQFNFDFDNGRWSLKLFVPHPEPFKYKAA